LHNPSPYWYGTVRFYHKSPSGCTRLSRFAHTSKRLRLPSRRIRLAEPMTQVGILHVFDHRPILEDERDLPEAARVERAENHFFALERGLKIIDAIGDVRPVPELPQAGLLGRHDRLFQRPQILDALRVGAWIRHPHFAEVDPEFAGLRLARPDADVIEDAFHGGLAL